MISPCCPGHVAYKIFRAKRASARGLASRKSGAKEACRSVVASMATLQIRPSPLCDALMRCGKQSDLLYSPIRIPCSPPDVLVLISRLKYLSRPCLLDHGPACPTAYHKCTFGTISEDYHHAGLCLVRHLSTMGAGAYFQA